MKKLVIVVGLLLVVRAQAAVEMNNVPEAAAVEITQTMPITETDGNGTMVERQPSQDFWGERYVPLGAFAPLYLTPSFKYLK